MHNTHSKFISDTLEKQPLSLKKLKGDASERMYFRTAVSAGESFILMQDTENPEKNSILNYVMLTEILEKAKVRVPRIYGKNIQKNILLLEDAGDISLFEAAYRKNDTTVMTLYKKSIDEMIKIHSIVPDSSKKPCFNLAFDTEKLMWELDFFLTHAKKCGIGFSDDDITFLRKEFRKICKFISDQKRVLTHRDYHSRNIMIKDNTPVIIDFQDARMGTPAYDLSSLLKDSYINLPETTVKKLLDYFFEKMQFSDAEISEFMPIFRMMTFQRSIKACGSFYYLNCEKNKTDYMPYIPIVLKYAKEALNYFPEYSELGIRFFNYFKTV